MRMMVSFKHRFGCFLRYGFFFKTFFGCVVKGVVISIVSEANGGSFAILLDGSSFEEIARAKFPYGLPYGLHGCWIPKN